MEVRVDREKERIDSAPEVAATAAMWDCKSQQAALIAEERDVT